MRTVTRAYQRIQLEPELLAEGTFENFDPDHLDTFYQEGDLGELRLQLDPDLPDSEIGRVQQLVEDIAQKLQERGISPWPSADRILFLDWPQRSLSMRFIQGWRTSRPDLPVAAQITGAGGSLSVLGEILLALFRSIPLLVRASLPFISKNIPILLRLLRAIPLSILIPSGVALFLLLAPEGTAWRIFRWVGKAIEKVVKEAAKAAVGLLEGLGPVVAIAAACLVLVGVSKLKRSA